MGKVIKLLGECDGQISCGNDVYANKENFMGIAYMCRIGILDRMEVNGWNLTTPITIPLGIFRTHKCTISQALNMTLGKLKQI